MAEPPEPGRCERQIMDAVYAQGDATVNQFVESIPDAPTAMAVRRMMHILEDFKQLLTANSGNQLNLSPSPKLPIPDTDPLSISIEIRPLETVDITLDVVVDREDPAFGDFEVRISGHLPGMNANDPRSYWTRNNTTKLTTGKFAIAVPRGLTMCNLYAQPIYMQKMTTPFSSGNDLPGKCVKSRAVWNLIRFQKQLIWHW